MTFLKHCMYFCGTRQGDIDRGLPRSIYLVWFHKNTYWTGKQSIIVLLFYFNSILSISREILEIRCQGFETKWCSLTCIGVNIKNSITPFRWAHHYGDVWGVMWQHLGQSDTNDVVNKIINIHIVLSCMSILMILL